ncbi:MAG: peptidoglycan bridge formation glycyltransferase FemA/FemB family protein [Actinobacteria bacterium]|nr:peptidoglycan bridge formation glycyltransferase FemA/FemB family protein [Actinomycetota bacterium]
MLFIKEYNLQQLQNWDEKLYSVGSEAGFCQSSCWAKIIGKIDNARPIFLEVYNNNEIVLSLLLFHKIPWDREKHKGNKGIYEYLSGKHKGWLMWMDGPVFHSTDSIKTLGSLRLILDWIGDYVKKNDLYKIESLGFPHQSKWTIDSDVKNLFVQFGYSPKTKATYLVDITLDEKEIWKNLKSSAKKSIKKAQKHCIKVIQIRSLEEYRNKFYLPYVEMEKDFGRVTNPWRAEEIQWNEGYEKFYHYFVAETANREIIATLGMYVYNGTATEIASSMSKKAYIEKIPAQDLLHWEMILEAKRLGCHTFDLAGVNPNPVDSKEKGIKQFKDKWGGVYTEYYTYEKVSSKFRAKLTGLLVSLYHKLHRY